MRFFPACFLAILFLGCGSSGEKKGPYDTDPREPDAALEAFEIVEGFRVELFASEPHVVDPVEMCFDENGGIYVAEMLDYPFDPEEGQEPRSRIRYLEDSDSDGRIDKATVFADKLLQATSVFPWKGGVFVAAAPDILYLKDTDGDHRADIREVVYTGFDDQVSPESRITNFRWGIDNWIYAANNGRPGKITSPQHPDSPAVYVRGYDFRFNPATGAFAPAAGPTQFGMSFDEWGNRFVTHNVVHLRHAVLPARYILRNPYYAPDSMLHYVPGDDPRSSKVYPLTRPQQWRVERTEARQERYDETRPGRIEHVGGHFTASTGTTVYLGDAFPKEFRGDVFIADANGSLVHREVLFDDGVTFRSEPRPLGKEFLASRDVWFRPVNFANAPDGALYVMDFYREYIEEPASIPEAIKERLQLDFYRGSDRGRIWRIVPLSPRVERGLKAALGGKTAAELVRTLEHLNGWHRLTAQRLLIERGGEAAIPALSELLSSNFPQARLHALWTLRGLGALEAEQVRAALGDEHPGVRANAVRLAESFLPALAEAIAARSGDSDPKVRFQAALSLGEIEGAHRAIAKTAAENAEDPWFRAALLSSSGKLPLKVLTRLVVRHRGFFSADGDAEGRRDFVAGLAALIGARRVDSELSLFLQTFSGGTGVREAEARVAALRGLARGLAYEGARGLRIPLAESEFTRLFGSASEAVREAALEAAQYFSLPSMMRDAVRAAGAGNLSIERRARAVRFLRGGDFAAVSPVLSKILNSASPHDVQLAAVETLRVFDDPATAEILLSGWSGYPPPVRAAVVEAMVRHRRRTGALLDALETGEVEPREIDPVARIRLVQHADEALRSRAARLLTETESDRAAVVEQYKDVAEMEADAARGKPAFDEHCAKCHMPRGERRRLGPDLSGVNNRTREELLAHILDPGFEIQPNYTNYILVDNNGRIHDGLLAGETAETVTLRTEESNVTLLRKNIAEMRASSVSLMPDGLEEDLTRQELADVIAYLRAGL